MDCEVRPFDTVDPVDPVDLVEDVVVFDSMGPPLYGAISTIYGAISTIYGAISTIVLWGGSQEDLG